MANVEAQAESLTAPVPLASFNFRIPALLPLLAVGLVVRLLLAGIPGFGVDMGTFQAWSVDLANNDPWNFYQDDKFTDYAPGYMYILWLIGEIHNIVTFDSDQYEYVLKIPSIVADLGSAYLIYKMLERRGPGVQLGATVLYLFFPAAMFIGAFWGQVDSILAFFLLLTVYFVARDRPVAGAVAFAIGFLVKPQAIAALPFLAFWILRDHPARPAAPERDNWLALVAGVALAIVFAMALVSAPFWMFVFPAGIAAAAVAYLLYEPGSQRGFRPPPALWLECAAYPVIVVLILITPFFQLEPWRLFEVLENATEVPNYRVNSFWAYNFWNTGGIFKMGFHCDIDSACNPPQRASEFLSLDTRYWSVILFGAASVGILGALRNARGTGFLALGTALGVLAFYMLLTRMHERYVFAFFLPFLLACVLIQSRALWAIFVTTAIVHFINLYHVFGYYYLFNPEERGEYPAWTRWRWFYRQLEDNAVFNVDWPILGTLETTQVLSIIFVTSFVALLPLAYVLSERRRDRDAPAEAA